MKKIFTFFAAALMSVSVFTKAEEPTHLDYDTPDADFEAVYNDYKLTEEYAEGYVIVEASNESSQTELAFLVAEGATSFTAGTYTCSLTQEPMTVYTGSCDGTAVYVSFFMDNNFNIWFPYAGEVTVSADGVIVFDVLNSYGRTIKVTLYPDKGTTGVDNITTDVKATKVLRNGQLLIEKNGKIYNATGAEVK